MDSEQRISELEQQRMRLEHLLDSVESLFGQTQERKYFKYMVAIESARATNHVARVLEDILQLQPGYAPSLDMAALARETREAVERFRSER